MTQFYQIEYSKKNKGWMAKKEGKYYSYRRVWKSPIFESIEDAEEWIHTNHKSKYKYDQPWIDHKIDGHRGHLMTIKEWKGCCDDGGFIDYDGYGDLVNSDCEVVGKTVSPSDYTEGRVVLDDAKYILWYNK